MITITGIWKNTDKEGKEYFSGNFGNAKILIFPNKNKTEDKHPDYNLCIAEKTSNSTAKKTSNSTTEKTSADNPFNDNDMPF